MSSVNDPQRLVHTMLLIFGKYSIFVATHFVFSAECDLSGWVLSVLQILNEESLRTFFAEIQFELFDKN